MITQLCLSIILDISGYIKVKFIAFISLETDGIEKKHCMNRFLIIYLSVCECYGKNQSRCCNFEFTSCANWFKTSDFEIYSSPEPKIL